MDKLLDYIMYEAHPLASILVSIILVLWLYSGIADLGIGKNGLRFKDTSEAYKVGVYTSLVLFILFFLYSFYRLLKYYL